MGSAVITRIVHRRSRASQTATAFENEIELPAAVCTQTADPPQRERVGITIALKCTFINLARTLTRNAVDMACKMFLAWAFVACIHRHAPAQMVSMELPEMSMSISSSLPWNPRKRPLAWWCSPALELCA